MLLGRHAGPSTTEQLRVLGHNDGDGLGRLVVETDLLPVPRRDGRGLRRLRRLARDPGTGLSTPRVDLRHGVSAPADEDDGRGEEAEPSCVAPTPACLATVDQ